MFASIKHAASWLWLTSSSTRCARPKGNSFINLLALSAPENARVVGGRRMLDGCVENWVKVSVKNMSLCVNLRAYTIQWCFHFENIESICNGACIFLIRFIVLSYS